MKRFWFLFLMPLITAPMTCVEAVCHWDDRELGQQRIEEARQQVRETGEWTTPSWWRDDQDPLDGLLDFASRPWVSAVRGGDCEDAMLLARSILNAFETIRAYVEGPGGWHAILLWSTPDGWRIITNMVLLPCVAPTAEAVAYMLFGSDTEDMLLLD